ncbi:WD40 repeat domain-containing protein [Anaeromassilibacillus senegalensis]|uniref:WD40 repeat domain-containing protein n=1 Tax=Anaeromassilibacillus senegalensis TaxID=1673717 RepID=UPI000AE67D52|nr:WD40 repeat domain-containing protein [Anaeromassilibacillus senegalensis]
MATIIGGDEGSGGFPKGWKEKCTGTAKESITKNSAIAAVPHIDLETGTLKNLSFSENPTPVVNYMLFSSDGKYLACGGFADSNLDVYKRFGDTFTKLIGPVDRVDSLMNSMSISLNGLYVAAGFLVQPFITIYKRIEDTYVNLTDAVNISASVVDLCFSSDGNYLACITTTALYVYKRSGDNFTELYFPYERLQNAHRISITADGTYIAIGSSKKASLYIYKRSKDTLTKLTELSVLVEGDIESLSFSSDGIYLAVGIKQKPYLIIYKRSNDTFTKLAESSVELIAEDISLKSVVFSSDGLYLLLVPEETITLYIYKRSGDIFTLLNRKFRDYARITCACFSPENDIVYMTSTLLNKIIGLSSRLYDVYNAENYIKPGTWDPSTKLGVAVESASAGSSCKINLFPEVNGG